MARYISPSPSPAPRSRSPSSSSRRPRSPLSLPKTQRRSPSPLPDCLDKDKAKDALKASLVFLGAYGAASLVANKFWPKGTLYGEKESWAHEAKDKVKHAVRGHPKDDSDHRRRRPQSACGNDQRRGSNLYRKSGHRRPPTIEMGGEVFAPRAAYRRTYSNG
ncbi:hypothetical protein F4779DRAFT_305043 [Xylariaceae sp. FL0662B]|nr:hypothetical protein F4779DRAFT_305043 [Xylariaceae sp. FL0662B]